MGPRTFKDFREEGLLWALNRYVLHPRGYAIAFHFDNENVIGWELLGDGSEVWSFDSGVDDDSFQRFEFFIKGEGNG